MSAMTGLTLPVRAQRSAAAGKPLRAASARSVRRVRLAASAEGKTFDPDWKRSDPVTHVVAILGWTLPSWTPAPSFGGESLFGLFNKSIAENLAHFPQGPAADDKFWLLMVTWHAGLFLTLLLGQIGVQGRKQGYFK